MNVKPYPFDKLPKVNRQEAQLLADLQEIFPRIGFSDELGRAIKILIQRELGVALSFRRESLSIVLPAEKIRTFPRQGVFLPFGMPPLEQKGVLELDPLIAHVAIDKLLGGTGEPPNTLRPLSEIEEGVLSYLFLKIFALIFERCGRLARVHFRMEGLLSAPEELLPLFRAPEKVVSMTFNLTLGERAGYARILLPLPMARKTFLEPLEDVPAKAQSGERDLAYYEARLNNLGFLSTSIWTELGRTTLKVRDINALETGDVIVLEKTRARVQGGLLAGQLPIRVGGGERGCLRGVILNDRDRLRVRLEAVELEQPV